MNYVYINCPCVLYIKPYDFIDGIHEHNYYFVYVATHTQIKSVTDLSQTCKEQTYM